MKLCRTTAELREEIALAKTAGKTIGLVPTMGALHEGHASLIKAAAMENELVVVSVFVNPTQFGPNEDLDAYPRTLDADCKLAESCGADIVFAPTPAEMYPSEDMTWVEVTGDITKVLCGRTRPIHFRGVTTVVAKLFNLAQPDHAYFGQKDAQQAEVLKRMVKDLFFNVKLRIMPIVREADGLAKSSRNTYLSKSERAAAVVLSSSLETASCFLKRASAAARNWWRALKNSSATSPWHRLTTWKYTPCRGLRLRRGFNQRAVSFGAGRKIWHHAPYR